MTVYFVCPECETSTHRMMLTHEKHEMSNDEIDIARKIEPIFEFIGNEILLCPKCDKKLTWFQMKRKEITYSQGKRDD